jgi:hypothetical protein
MVFKQKDYVIIILSDTYHSTLPAADPICMWVAAEVVMAHVINELAGYDQQYKSHEIRSHCSDSSQKIMSFLICVFSTIIDLLSVNSDVIYKRYSLNNVIMWPAN